MVLESPTHFDNSRSAKKLEEVPTWKRMTGDPAPASPETDLARSDSCPPIVAYAAGRSYAQAREQACLIVVIAAAVAVLRHQAAPSPSGMPGSLAAF